MFLVLIFCVTLKNSPYISINVFKIPTFFHRQKNWFLSFIFANQTNETCHIDPTMDILVISIKMQGHNWFFCWTFSLIFILSPRFSPFLPNHHQPHKPILNHHHPLHHQFAQICSLCCRYQRHPILPRAVREPFKLQVTTTVRTRL